MDELRAQLASGAEVGAPKLAALNPDLAGPQATLAAVHPYAEGVLGQVCLLRGAFGRAREVFTREHPDFALNRRVVEAIENPALLPDVLAETEAAQERRSSYHPTELMMMLGARDRALDRALAEARAGTFDPRSLWRPYFIREAGDPRFALIVEAAGLPPYWDASGWPSFCRRTGGGFVCEAPGSAAN